MARCLVERTSNVRPLSPERGRGAGGVRAKRLTQSKGVGQELHALEAGAGSDGILLPNSRADSILLTSSRAPASHGPGGGRRRGGERLHPASRASSTTRRRAPTPSVARLLSPRRALLFQRTHGPGGASGGGSSCSWRHVSHAAISFGVRCSRQRERKRG